MIYTKRIESIDGVLNRTLVAQEIVKELGSIGAISSTNSDLVEAISTYVQNFLVSTFSLVELMSVEARDIVCRVYDEVVTDFAESHTELSDKYGVDTIKDFFTENTYNLTDLFEMVFVNCEDTEHDFCDYVGYYVGNEDDEEDDTQSKGNDFDFNVQISFEINCDESDDADFVETELNKRIGKNAAYKWRAAKISAFACIYNNVKYMGVMTLKIHGNSTYTEETIKSAIYNRLGANAKRLAWNEFVIIDLHFIY